MIDYSQATDVIAIPETKKPFVNLYDECDKIDKFAGGDLPKLKGGRQLKCSTDQNRVEKLVQFPNKTVVFKAKASVDADGSPVSRGKNRSLTDQCGTWLTYDYKKKSGEKDCVGFDETSPLYVDSEQVPFVVIPTDPKSKNISFMKSTGIGKGDIAVAMYKGQCAFGVVGDAGPYFRLGEVSIAAHAELGNPQCKNSDKPCTELIGNKSGKGIPSGVTYIIFPKTRPKPLTAENVVSVSKENANKELQTFLLSYEKK
jgi:hypothetical protein